MVYRILGFPINKENIITALYYLSVIIAILILVGAIGVNNSLAQGSAGYLLITFLMYRYFNTEEKQHKDYEIAQLKQEIRKLEDIKKSDESIIKLLETELANVRNTNQN